MRPIDADSLETHEIYEGEWVRVVYADDIDDAPTIEVEPVRRGRWLPDNNCYWEMRFVCSECKESEVVPTTGFTRYAPIWDYCPNCGAKMEAEDE